MRRAPKRDDTEDLWQREEEAWRSEVEARVQAITETPEFQLGVLERFIALWEQVIVKRDANGL